MSEQTTLQHIQAISLIFLLPIGIVHLISGALFATTPSLHTAELTFRITFLPFLITAITYSFSSLKKNINTFTNNNNHTLSMILLGLGATIIVGFSLLYFLFPNA